MSTGDDCGVHTRSPRGRTVATLEKLALVDLAGPAAERCLQPFARASWVVGLVSHVVSFFSMAVAIWLKARAMLSSGQATR